MLYSHTIKLVRLYDGADGLKTGHTDNAGYCLAATAKRNGMRLIAIVLGENTAKIRNSETTGLLDYGFNNKKVQNIKKSNDVIKKVTLDKASIKNVNVYPKYDINILQAKGVNNKKYKITTKINNIKLPAKKESVVGKITVKEKNKTVYVGDLVIKQDISKLNFVQLYLRNMQSMIIGEVGE